MSEERKKPYVEDSTIGSSQINPLDYKDDVLVQVWVDSRVLATLNLWLEKNRLYPRFMSEVVREPLKNVFEIITSDDPSILIDDTAEARRMLESRFRVNLNRGNRGKKNVLHNQVLSNRRNELAGGLKRGNQVNDKDIPLRKQLTDEQEDHLAKQLIWIEENKRNTEARAKAQERIEEMKAEGQVAGIKEGITAEELIERENKSLEEIPSVEDELKELGIKK